MEGDLTVGLVRDHRQHRYSVKGLVARAFVPGETELFNNPILLDCDKHNLRAENIVWRPRWFAWQYTHQFKETQSWYSLGPIEDLKTGDIYKDYVDVAVTNGLLCADIKISVYTTVEVFPTRQIFAFAE
jgi:hypothetical protein